MSAAPTPEEYIAIESRRLEQFNERVRDYAHVDLLDAYAQAYRANQYGAKVAEMAVLRYHILTRMSGGAPPEDA